VVQVHAADGGRGVVPGAKKPAFHPAPVSPTGTTGKGPRNGGVSGLRAMGHAEASAEASASDCPEAISERSGECAADDDHEGDRIASTLQSADIVLPTTNGREIRLRRITEPPQSGNDCSGSLASACPNTFNSTANVVQTRPLPEPIFNGLGLTVNIGSV
jgi:hypothetical protein